MPKKKFPEEECTAPMIAGRCNYPMGPDKRCLMTAGWGTPHVGEGTCRKHGGHGAPIIHGRYSKFNVSKPLQEKYQEMLNDPDYKSLKDEVAKARAHLVLMEEKESKFKDEESFYKACDGMLNTIAKLAVTAHKIEEGDTYNINVQQMSYIIQALIRDIDEVCEGCPRRKQLAERFGQVELITAPAMITGGEDGEGL